MREFWIVTRTLAALVSIVTPRPFDGLAPPKFSIVTLSMLTLAALRMRMPLPVVVPTPLIEMFLRVTVMPAALIKMPLVLEARIEPLVPAQSMVIDLPMVTAPKPPGSRQLISPPAAVLEIAPAKVLHGAVRLHGLRSSPTPETQVRLCALAVEGASAITKQIANNEKMIRRIMTVSLGSCELVRWGAGRAMTGTARDGPSRLSRWRNHRGRLRCPQETSRLVDRQYWQPADFRPSPF